MRLFSHNRFNALSFHDADHGDGSRMPLREQVERHLTDAGVDAATAARSGCSACRAIFGYGFNPLSIYFCYDGAGSLAAILYEVHNTFGERHSYLIPACDRQSAGGVIDQQCAKTVLRLAVHGHGR